jgi:hypothetical protein
LDQWQISVDTIQQVLTGQEYHSASQHASNFLATFEQPVCVLPSVISGNAIHPVKRVQARTT